MNSPVRAFLSLLVLSFIGFGVYFGGVKVLNVYKVMKKSSLEKQISVKPKNINEKQTLADPWSINIEEFTFFDTLDDPSMSKFIGINDNIIEPQQITNKVSDFYSKVKTNSILQPDKVNTKKFLNPITHEIENQKQGEFLASGFTLQVGSFKILERANLLKNNLSKKGYPAFVVAVQISEAGEIWHRVVLGTFEKKEHAIKTKIKVKEMENLDSVIKWQEGPYHKVLP